MFLTRELGCDQRTAPHKHAGVNKRQEMKSSSRVICGDRPQLFNMSLWLPERRPYSCQRSWDAHTHQEPARDWRLWLICV